MDATIPALLTTPTGQIVDAESGAVLSDQDAGSLLAATLETYRRASVEAEALRLRIEDRKMALLAGDNELDGLTEQLSQTAEVRLRIEATLAAMFTDRAGKVSIDTPAAKVTWSEGRQTWSLAHPASWYVTAQALNELVALLYRLRCEDVSDVTNGELANAIIAWLAPTAKTGEPPAPRITLRDGER